MRKLLFLFSLVWICANSYLSVCRRLSENFLLPVRSTPLLLLLCLLVFSCRGDEEMPVPGSPLPPGHSVFIDTAPDHSAHLYQITPSGDELVIRGLEREGGSLVIMVQFGGGCEPHDFKLLKQGSHHTGSTAISSWLLHHNNNGDLCKAWPVQYLFFDLGQMQTRGAVLEPYKTEYLWKVE